MNHQVTVVKCGGSPLIDREAICADIAALAASALDLAHRSATETRG